MVRINFNLRNAASKTPTPINTVIRYSGKQFVYSTRLCVLPKYWDKKKKEVKAVLAFPCYADMNEGLNQLEKIINDVYKSLQPSINDIDPKIFKIEIDKATNRIKQPLSNFWDFVDYFIETAPNRTSDKGITLSFRTVQRYNTTRRVLKEYEEEAKTSLSFESLDLEFFQDFRNYLASKNYSPNTMAKHTETLKSFIRAAAGRKINVNNDYLIRGTGTKRKESFDVYMNDKDLQALTNMELPNKLDKVRDMFLISCYTGLRFSDWESINKGIKGDFIHVIQYKTKQPVVIPIDTEIKRILDKYNGSTPEAISNQKFNEYIKEACRIAGITESIQFPEEKGGKVTFMTKEKYLLITAHTGRRTYATRQYLAGKPIPSIMKVTGHKSVKTFLGYLKLDAAEHGKLMAK
ncbi:MAG TPA: site-specific integrase [Edaphocola sp.]|nr:site-specific integrase [Edaphocola sp.]